MEITFSSIKMMTQVRSAITFPFALTPKEWIRAIYFAIISTKNLGRHASDDLPMKIMFSKTTSHYNATDKLVIFSIIKCLLPFCEWADKL